MTNEEKALELAEANIRVYENSQYEYAFYAIRDACIEMAEWKDEQHKWHKVADGDLPRENCNVLAFIDDGFATYYDVLNYDDGNFFRYGKEQYSVIAWMYFNKYEDEE